MDFSDARTLFIYNDYKQDKDGEAGGCGYYRIVGPGEALQEAGYTIEIIHNPPKKWKTWENYLQEFDLIVVHHPDHPAFVATLAGVCQYMQSRFVVDLDDNYLQVDPSNPASIVYFEGSPAVTSAMRAVEWANLVTVTTPELKNVYNSLQPDITVLPNAIDLSLWEESQTTGEEVVIGYAGSPTHEKDLMSIKEALERVLEKRKHVSLKFMNYVPAAFLEDFRGRITHVKGETSYKKFAKTLPTLGFDIGIAPLVDIPFNKSKSDCKWLEYSAMAIPTVASRIGPYRKRTIHGKTALLCRDVDEWEEALLRLVDDEAERKKIGRAAHQYVLENCTFDATISLWESAYTQLLAGKHDISRNS